MWRRVSCELTAKAERLCEWSCGLDDGTAATKLRGFNALVGERCELRLKGDKLKNQE